MIFSALEIDTINILALLNVGGLVNNLDNFLADINIQSARVIWITETHLRNLFNESQLIIQNKMPDSYIIFSNSNDNYKSLALVFKKRYVCISRLCFTLLIFVCAVAFILLVSVI